MRERLEQIIEDRKAKRIDAAQQLKLFEVLTKEMRGHADAAEKLGLTETGFAIYGLLRGGPGSLAETKGALWGKPHEAKTALASVLEEQLEPQASIVDWPQKDDVQREAPHQAPAPDGELRSERRRARLAGHPGPVPLIEYVLVHELAHLRHRGHDRAFWQAVGQWMPDYESRRTRLRELGPSLVW